LVDSIWHDGQLLIVSIGLSVILAQSLAALLDFQQSIMIDKASGLNNALVVNNF
jgi:hypothetical protein